MRQNPHVRICGGPGSATTLVYPTASMSKDEPQTRARAHRRGLPVAERLLKRFTAAEHVEELDILRARIDGSRAAGDRLRAAARATSRHLAGAVAAARRASGTLDGAVRTHRSELQDTRRLVGAGLTRIQQHIEKTRESYGPSR